MKNYLTIAQRWADVKAEIVIEHERVTPLVNKIIEDFKRISGQNIRSQHIGTPCKLLFYPFWEGGFVYTYSSDWSNKPKVDKNWEWTLSEAQAVLTFLKSLHEEEVKILFRNWSEKCCQ